MQIPREFYFKDRIGFQNLFDQGPSADCAAKTEFRQLSAAAKAAILDKHNELRRRVAKGEETGGINAPQPAAANMRKMVRCGTWKYITGYIKRLTVGDCRCGARSWRPSPRGGRTSAPSATTP